MDSGPKAEILLEQFSSVFSTLKTNIMPHISRYVEESLEKIEIDQKGTEKLLKNLNISKSSGPDNIPNVILKECAVELASIVTLIFKKSLDMGRRFYFTTPKRNRRHLHIMYSSTANPLSKMN